MSKAVRINDRNLLGTLARFPPEILQDDSKRSFWLSIAIIKHFFGPEWLERHVSFEKQTPGFLRVVAGSGPETQKSTFKIVDFGELLFNLQNTDGFDNCIEQMRNGNIEATYAELDLGRMLYSAGANFRFVIPQGKKWADYDVEISLADGTVVCTDAKCKIETTEFSAETVLNTLRDARKQFPPDRPSAIFVKTPSRWLESIAVALELVEIARTFLRSTKRVVTVKLYSEHLIYHNGMLRHTHAFKEICNPNNRFDPDRNWDMFAEPTRTTNWNGMPLRWKRLIFYPKDGPDQEI